MRILFLTQVYSDCVSGGEGTAVWELSNFLAEKGLKIFVVTPFVRIKGKHHSNIKVYKVPFCKGEPLAFSKDDKLKAFFFSIPLLFLKKIDIIHQANGQGPNPFARFKFDRPFVETADYPWEYDDPDFRKELLFDQRRKMVEAELPIIKKSFFDRLFGRFSLIFYRFFRLNDEFPREVDLYVCREELTIEKLKSLDYQSNFLYLPMGVDTEKLRPDIKPIEPKDGDKFVFLFAGRVSKRKSADIVIKAFNKISPEHPQAELFLVGSGTNDYFIKLAEGNPRIRFAGQKIGEELIRYFAYGDIFVGPQLSKLKGINKTAVENMALAKPVILTRAYDTERIKEKVGFWVLPKDIDGLAKTMERAIKNRALLKGIGDNARAYVLKNYSWRNHAANLIEAYKKLLK